MNAAKMPDTRLPVRGYADAMDFWGDLFVHYPADWDWTKCLRAVESAAAAMGFEELTPTNLRAVFVCENMEEFKKLPPWAQERLTLAALRERQMRWYAAGKQPAPLPPPKWAPNGGPRDPRYWNARLKKYLPPQPPKQTPAQILGDFNF